ncbi:MAG TPA: tetratricopeptide repeat protein [Herpetosiphonaceae bacterium]|nr:tetratricopeptide repeat protein [Herpetosiphonaceae bacterium]
MSSAPSGAGRRWRIALFFPVVLFVLAGDSAWLAARGWDGRLATMIAAPAYLLLMLGGLRHEHRIMTLVFVPFTAAGEYLFSIVFQWYTYRAGGVPAYVPFGHAILLATGILIVDSPWVVRHTRGLRRALLLFHGLLTLGALLVYGDTLSALLGLILLGVLIAYRGRLLYLVIGVLVLYIELVGTWLGCWRWGPAPFGVLRTTNPPVGAFVCYVLAEVMVMQSIVWVLWMRRHRRAPGGARGTRGYYSQQLALIRLLYDPPPADEAPAAPAPASPEADPYGRGYAAGALGLTYAALDDLERALTCFERVAAQAAERGDPAVAALAAWHSGRIHLRAGRPELARPLMQRYVDHLRATGHPDAARHAAELAAVDA